MNVKRLVRADGSSEETSPDTVIGVQGRQGCNRYYHYDMDSTDLAYITKTDNIMNIYNYLCGAGTATGIVGPTGATGPSVGIMRAPTETYAFGYFDLPRHGSYDVNLTPNGFTVPFYLDYRQGIFMDSSNNRYHFYYKGIYEISYHVCLKDAAAMGTRLSLNNQIVEASEILPENLETEYSATCTIKINYIYTWYNLSLELFSSTDQTVTLKGGAGASILIKKISEL